VTKQVEAVHLLRSFTAEELVLHLQEQRRRLFEVRFQQAAGQVENHRQVRELRREIARTMTLQLELVRGHHLASDLPEVEEEPEEQQPRPRRLGRRRAAPEPVAEGEPETFTELGAEMPGDEPAEAEVAAPAPEEKPRRARRRREAAPVAEDEPEEVPAGEPAEEVEAVDEGATDEEQTDE
jgi:large subunit ribosomal protein L29